MLETWVRRAISNAFRIFNRTGQNPAKILFISSLLSFDKNSILIRDGNAIANEKGNKGLEEKKNVTTWKRKNGITREVSRLVSRGTSVSFLFTSVCPSPYYSRHNVHQRVSTRSEFMQRSWLRYPRLSVTQAHTCNARTFMRTPPLSYILHVSLLPLEVVLLIYFRVNLITRSLAMRRLKLPLFSFGIRLLVSLSLIDFVNVSHWLSNRKRHGNVALWEKLDFFLDLREFREFVM